MNGKQSKKLRAMARLFFSLPMKPPSMQNLTQEQIYHKLKVTQNPKSNARK